MTWRRHATCAQVGWPDVWFPEDGNYRPARRVCERCPVKAECLAEALAAPHFHGMWGAQTPRQRLASLTPEQRRKATARLRESPEKCVRGHPFDDTNTYVHKGKMRQCRTCRRERTRAVRAAAKAAADE